MWFLRTATNGQDQLHLAYQPLPILVLLKYLEAWKPYRLLAWAQRRPDREYKISLPLAVAKAFHEEMQSNTLTEIEQLFLNKLDQAVVNYRNPNAEPHVIGELVRPA